MNSPSPLWPSQWPRPRRLRDHLWLATFGIVTIWIIAETVSTFTLSGLNAATVICASGALTLGAVDAVYWSLRIRVRQRHPTAIRLINDPSTGQGAVRIPYYAPLVIALGLTFLAGTATIAATAALQLSEALSPPMSPLECVEGTVLAGFAFLMGAFAVECLWRKRIGGHGVILSNNGIWRRTMFRETRVPWDAIQEIYAASGGDYQRIAIRCVPGTLPARSIHRAQVDTTSRIANTPLLDSSVMLIQACALACDPAVTLRALRLYHLDTPRRTELGSQDGVDRIRALGGTGAPAASQTDTA